MQASYAFPQVRKAYRELYAKRANLFRDLEPLAQVGLGFLYNQSMLENAEHLKLAYAVKDALGREHFLWDALTEEDIDAIDGSAVAEPEMVARNATAVARGRRR